MEYCIAVGTADGKTVTEHFGQCRRYSVYLVESGSGTYRLEETRDVMLETGAGGHASFEPICATLQGCQAVLIRKIGPAAERFLRGKGILPLEYAGRIDTAFEKLVPYLKTRFHDR